MAGGLGEFVPSDYSAVLYVLFCLFFFGKNVEWVGRMACSLDSRGET